MWRTALVGRVMAIYKRVRKDGSVAWQVVVDEYDRATGKRIRHTVGTWLSQKQAKKEEAAAKVKVNSRTFVGKTQETVADMTALWLASRTNVLPQSQALYERIIKHYIDPVLGTVYVQALTPAHVQRAVNTWVGDGKKKRYATAAKSLDILSAVCSMAVTLTSIPRNPCKGIVRPKSPVPTAHTIWTERQTIAFLTAAEHDDLSLLWFLLVETGMRRGEALGIARDSVDLDASSIQIRAIAVPHRVPGEPNMRIQHHPKTRASQRTILISTGLTERFRVWMATHDTGTLVFSRDGDVPLHGEFVLRRVRSLARTAGVPEPTVHDLRHLAATRMARAGVPMVVAMHRMGHSSKKMLEQVYQHADIEMQRDAVAKLDALSALSSALPKEDDDGDRTERRDDMTRSGKRKTG